MTVTTKIVIPKKQNKLSKKAYKIALIALIFAIIGWVLPGVSFTNTTYINATDITPVGFSSSAGNNVSLISAHDNRPWNGTEAAGSPWTVYVTFTNVSEFNYVESIMKYNSTGVSPSQHEVNMSVWCVTNQEWEEIVDLSLDLEYHYRSTKFINSSHYISPILNGTVVLKLNHGDAGNANHRLWIDLLRLANEPQFESVIINNTVTGGSSAPCTNCINSTQLSDNMSLKVNKSGDFMTGDLHLGNNRLLNVTNINNNTMYFNNSNTVGGGYKMAFNDNISYFANSTGVQKFSNDFNFDYIFQDSNDTLPQTLVAFQTLSSVSTGFPFFQGRRARGSTNVSNSSAIIDPVQDGDVMFRVVGTGWDGITWGGSSGAIDFVANGTWTSVNHPTKLEFYTRDDTGGFVKRMTVLKNGSVKLESLVHSTATANDYVCVTPDGVLITQTAGCV